MNTRRQTVWLVSMLGLMVVLSAYYLFTDEVDQMPVGTEQTVSNEVVVEGVGLMDPTAAQQQVTIDDIATLEGAGEQATEGNGTDTNVDATAEATSSEEAVTNEEVLEQVANQSGADAITTMQITRDSNFSKQLEELTVAMTDEEATDAQIAEAFNKHNALMDLEAKLIAFEEKLLGNYEDIAVMYDQEKEHFTVHVLAAQLEKSEAVAIVTQAMNELNIAIHQISVKLNN
jgi:stage III sporulation protein AH